ncbi:MAG: hypothetical protein GY828_03455 [Candidatus Gracilibacteria bacterium]|nr:hypothetical protein [Candidatus Gracilibacteria bacterium]
MIQKLSTKTLSREYKNIEPELQKVVDIIASNEDEDLEETLDFILRDDQKSHLEDLVKSKEGEKNLS